MLAPKVDLATATDIWTAWADEFTSPNGPQLPLEFRIAALDTLTATLITPAALSVQTLILAQWALHSIPIECLQAATYGDLYNEEEMTAWYGITTHPLPPNPQHNIMFDPYIILVLYLTLANFGSQLHTFVHTNYYEMK